MLNNPTNELASRIMTEVDFDSRLIGFSPHPRLGVPEVALYSFEEVLGFLSLPLNQLDFEKLEEWLRTEMKDDELADEISRAASIDMAHDKKNLAVAELLAIRFAQCTVLMKSPEVIG